MLHGLKNLNINQKQYCNTFNKNFKNGSHPKIILINKNKTYTYVFLKELLLFSYQVVSSSLWTPRTVAHQTSLSLGFPRQKYWNLLPFPSPRALPNPGIEPVSPVVSWVTCVGRWILYHWATPENPLLKGYVIVSNIYSPCFLRHASFHERSWMKTLKYPKKAIILLWRAWVNPGNLGKLQEKNDCNTNFSLQSQSALFQMQLAVDTFH